MEDILILVGFVIVVLVVVAIITKLLRLSWMILKALIVISIIAGLFFGLMYSTGMLEKFPFVYDLAHKLKDLLKPVHDFSKTV